jgi:hypothetical protein
MATKYKNGKPIHPDFDGHLEKSVSGMTPSEKLDYLWMAMEFNYFVKTEVKIIKSKNKSRRLKK